MTVPSDPRTILVIEDDPAVQQVLRLFLDHVGYHTRVAATAEMGARTLRHHDVRAVLFDLSVVQGEPVARLRSWRSARPGRPFILCTAWDPARLTTLFGDDPPDGFLPKPFTSAQLYAELNRVLELRPAPPGTTSATRPHVPDLWLLPMASRLASHGAPG
jgi:two-component system phosphate regulon response regulator PhoB